MESLEKAKAELEHKIKYADELITQCEEMKEEWKKRIEEAENAKDNFRELMKYLLEKD